MTAPAMILPTMRPLLATFVFTATAASIIAQPAARPSGQERVAQALAAKAGLTNPAGLQLLNQQWRPHGSLVLVRVRNNTTADAQFDHHQLIGVDAQTLEPTAAGDVRFELADRATYTVRPGETRVFKVTFFNRRSLAAVRWADGTKWCGVDGRMFDTAQEAGVYYHEQLLARRRDQKSHQLRQLSGQPVQK